MNIWSNDTFSNFIYMVSRPSKLKTSKWMPSYNPWLCSIINLLKDDSNLDSYGFEEL